MRYARNLSVLSNYCHPPRLFPAPNHAPVAAESCVPPHPSRYALDTFSRLGEGFYSYAPCKTLGCSARLSQSAKSNFRTQLRPRGTPMKSARAGEARPNGKYSRGRMALAPIRAREFSLPRGRQCRLPVLFQQLLRHNAAFFGTFLGSKKVPYPPSPFVPSFPPSLPTSPQKRAPPSERRGRGICQGF